MKPEIVSFGLEGRHNENLDEASQRILKAGLYKDQSIVVIMPAIRPIPPKVAMCHWTLMFPPNQRVVRLLAEGMEVGEAYSQTIERCLEDPYLSTFKFVLTVETDNTPPVDGVLNLIARMEEHPEFSCIGGIYFTKGVGGVPQLWGDPTDPVTNFRPQVPRPGELQEVCGTGMGFNLWRMDMFRDEKIERPLFRTRAGVDGVATQDLSFWGEARKHGYRCAVDCAVRVGHWDDASGINW